MKYPLIPPDYAKEWYKPVCITNALDSSCSKIVNRSELMSELKRGDAVLYHTNNNNFYYNIGILLDTTEDGWLVCCSVFKNEDGSLDFTQNVAITKNIRPVNIKEHNHV